MVTSNIIETVARMPPPDTSQLLTFRCPKELEGLLPPPIPAAQGLAGLVENHAARGVQRDHGGPERHREALPAVRGCDDLGFLIPLICDIKFENGEFSWDNDLPPCSTVNFPRSPIGLHDSTQLTGTPFFESDRFVIKFHNLWTIEAPEGYSLLFTHPVNRFDLPFTTLTGWVDWRQLPRRLDSLSSRWRDTNFSGVLPKGTPVAQAFR